MEVLIRLRVSHEKYSKDAKYAGETHQPLTLETPGYKKIQLKVPNMPRCPLNYAKHGSIQYVVKHRKMS